MPRPSVFGKLQARNEITVGSNLVVALLMVRNLSLKPDGCLSTQEISYFYGSLMSFTVFTRFCILILTPFDWTQFKHLPHIVRSVLITTYHLYVLYQVVSFVDVFNKCYVCTCHVSHVCYIPRHSHAPWLNNRREKFKLWGPSSYPSFSME